MVVKYRGHNRQKLFHNHNYVVDVELPGKGVYTYGVHFKYDCDLDEEVDNWLYFSSRGSLEYYFEFDAKELDRQAD